MTSIREAVRRYFQKASPLAPGNYSYISPPEDPRNYRLHLRIEPDGNGLLLINAATVLHLNQTATEFAYHLVTRTPLEVALQQLSKRYRAPKEQIQLDYDQFIQRIQTIIETPDLDPETFLDFEPTLPYLKTITAPYRLDCALTYRLPEGIDPSFAPTKRVDRELTTEEWKQILKTAWDAGIPHVTFTGGEPTLRSDLPELIAYAESLGQVTGLLSDGFRFSDLEYLDQILKTGIDHLLIVFQPEKELSWGGLNSALAEDLFVAAHLTLTPKTAQNANQMLDYLQKQGVKAISLSAVNLSLSEQLTAARNHAAEIGLDLIWNLPVPYSSINPIALELQEHGTTSGAGRAWLYVEPDGDVLPAQGTDIVLGNLLRDTWDKVWAKAKEFSQD